MGARSGFGLKLVQWLIRFVQFCCAAIILGIFSYFLATLHNHNLRIQSYVRAVEGISGAAVLYTLAGLVFLCCLAGIAFFSLFAIVLDVAFIGAFIYVAWENRHGASRCSGYVDTPFGRGQSGSNVQGSDGFTSLPSFHTACRLQTASLAVAIIAIFFFIFSILMELVLARHHRKDKRFGPSPANNYTSGYGDRANGRFGRFFRRRGGTRHADKHGVRGAYNENALPEHTHPGQLGAGEPPMRQSYATETTAVNDPSSTAHGYGGYAGGAPPASAGGHLYNKYENAAELPSGQTHGYTGAYGSGGAAAQQQGAPNYRYGDGVYERS